MRFPSYFFILLFS